MPDHSDADHAWIAEVEWPCGCSFSFGITAEEFETLSSKVETGVTDGMDPGPTLPGLLGLMTRAYFTSMAFVDDSLARGRGCLLDHDGEPMAPASVKIVTPVGIHAARVAHQAQNN